VLFPEGKNLSLRTKSFHNKNALFSYLNKDILSAEFSETERKILSLKKQQIDFPFIYADICISNT